MSDKHWLFSSNPGHDFMRQSLGKLSFADTMRLVLTMGKSTTGTELIRRTCEHFGYTNFINSINGTKYYTKDAFREMGINLYFLRRNDDIRYKQRSDEYVPDLSIIDLMMFCSRDELHNILNSYHFL